MRRWRAVAGLSSVVLASALVVLTPGLGAAEPDAAGKRAAEPVSIRSQLGLSPAERLVEKYAVRDRDGTVHIRYDRTYHGLPVVGGDLVVHRGPSGKVGFVDWASDADLSTLGDLTPSVSKSAASAVARRTTDLASTAADARLVVYAIGDHPRLAWETTASRGLGNREVVYVNAESGRRMAGWSLVESADGTGHSLYSGTVTIQTDGTGPFTLSDPTRGNGRVLDNHNVGDFPPTGTLFTDADNDWGDGTPSNPQSAAVDAAYGAQETWDFYQTQFGRNGIANDGVGARSFVHYSNALPDIDNAFWSDDCFCMVYGDGDGTDFGPLVSLDVAGHEMSHGVMSHTANLIYVGESGGLNEANSDIFGTMVEFFAGNANDPGDYYIGEKIVKTAPNWLRRMDNPNLDGQSYNCWNPTMGRDDVHFTSGPGNHFFYLLAEGSGAKTIGGLPHNSPTCNGSVVTGIGRDAASRIWYRAINVYMTSTTNYKVARDATIRAARDLFGAGSTQCARVAAAWSAVNVGKNDWACSGTPAAQGANVVANPGFESGSSAWTATPNVITTLTAPAFPWIVPHSGSWYAYLDGYGNPHTDSVRQTITVPNSTTARLRFWLLINTSDSTSAIRDRFKVQVVSGGTTTLATYNNTQANDTYTRKNLTMSAFRGDQVILRFVGTENASLQTSFLLDDVKVSAH